jgi:hypothetical protein
MDATGDLIEENFRAPAGRAMTLLIHWTAPFVAASANGWGVCM